MEIIACKPKEEFASYYIKQLLDSDFGRKPQKSRAFTSPSPIGSPPVATSPSPGLSAPIPAYIPTHPTQPSGIGSTPETYGIPAALGTPAPSISGTGSTRGVYMYPSGPISVAYIQPPGTGPLSAALGIGPTSAAYPPPSGTRATPTTYTQ